MPTNKALVGLVVGMGVLIVVGLGVLAYGLVRKASDPSFGFFRAAPSAAGAPNIAVPLPAGTSVVSVDRSGDFLMVHTVDDSDTSIILFLDPGTGRVVRTITFGERK